MARLSSQKNEIGVGFETYDEGKEYFDALLEMQEEIESGLGFSLDWDRLDGKKMSRIGIQKKADVSSEDDWIDSFKWQEQRLSKLNEVFRPIIKDL